MPFYIRTGKDLPVTQTELRLILRRPPRLGFHGDPGRVPEAGQIVVRLDPTAGIRLLVEAQRGGVPRAEQFALDLDFSHLGGEPTPYEVLLHAAMVGDSTRFTRQDSVEQTWRVLEPLLDPSLPVHPYAKGSWGPEAAERLVAHHGGWHGPWVGS